MMDVVFDTIIDSVKLLPFLFLTYLAMEYLEHKTSAKTKRFVKNSGKAGPVIGALLGAVPQCGFSTAASNLYAGKVITMGTLIAIFMSTSDEMIPVFLSEQVNVLVLVKLILMKIIIGLIMCVAIDFIVRRTKKSYNMVEKIGHVCDHDHCGCETSIFKSALRHTITIFAFIVVISFALNTVIHFVGEDTLGNIILNKPVIGPMISGIIGLIPNCASSVVLTQLYIEGVLGIGSLMAGLLAGSGVGILVLFRENDDMKDNLRILAILYVSGVAWGIIIDALSKVIM